MCALRLTFAGGWLVAHHGCVDDVVGGVEAGRVDAVV